MRFVHDHLYPLFVTVALTAAAILWFNLPEPVAPKTLTLKPEAWSLPKERVSNAKADLETITNRNLWGAPPAAAASAPKAPEWRVIGIARSGSDRFVLLAYEGKPIETLKVNDALPDGLKIVQIDPDRFFVQTPDKKKIAYGMYKNDPAK
jgi:hypothetical protein